jgi:hypothetical protein
MEKKMEMLEARLSEVMGTAEPVRLCVCVCVRVLARVCVWV